jgi:hypothetical protein
MNEYPDWNDGVTPHTHTHARITRYKNVKNADVIEVVNARYRNATLTGKFQLAKPPTAKLPGRLQIRCSWFGVTPRTTYPQLSIAGVKYKRISGYNGKVADDISV